MSSPDGSLGHELRSPLNHILGYSEIAIEDASALGHEEVVVDLNRIHAAGQGLLAVIESTLAPAALKGADVPAETLEREVWQPLEQIETDSARVEEQAVGLHLDGMVADAQKIRRAAQRLRAVVTERIVTGRPVATPELPPISAVPRPASEPGMILVVDDSRENREMLARRLERLGHRVECAADGVEALARVRSRSYDVILLDIWMPKLDGLGVLEQLKADEELRAIPVIVISSEDDPQIVLRCIGLGADDHLRKPCDPVFLRTRIDACLEKKRLRDREQAYLDQIEEEKRRSDELLHVILPPDVATELKLQHAVRPRRFEDVGVLFCDIVGFTAFTERTTPEALLVHLQTIVELQEEASSRYGLEKIKTIGDAFLAAAGLGTDGDPALACVRCGLEMAALAAQVPPYWQVRVGIHCGPVFAEVVGRRKYQYDIWGDTVNTASRIEHAAIPGSVCVSRSTWDRVASHCLGEPMGLVEIKGKRAMELVQVTGLRPEACLESQAN